MSSHSLLNIFSSNITTHNEYSDPVKAPHLVHRGLATGGLVDYALTRQETTIGRSKKNHITISSEETQSAGDHEVVHRSGHLKEASKISKLHATILRSKDSTFIKDQGTKDKPTNGITVNGEKVLVGQKRILKNGDVIIIGFTFELTFYESSDKVRILYEKTSDVKFDGLYDLPNLDFNESLISDRSHTDTTTTPSKNTFERTFSETQTPSDKVQVIMDYEKLRCLYEISKVSTESGTTVHFEKATDMIFSTVPLIEYAAIFLKDKKQEATRIKYMKSKTKANSIKNTSELVDNAFFNNIIDLKKTLSTNWREKGTIIGAPLIGSEVSGVFCFYSLTPITPSVKEIALITAIANNTSTTIDNAVLLAAHSKAATLKEQISRFLSPEIVKNMTDHHHHELMNQGAKRVKATILFVDIRGFTSYSEKCSPEQVVAMLNEYFERLVQCVFRFNGVVDKFVGDCLMGVFGAVEDIENPASRAINAALAIQASIEGDKGLNAFLKEQGNAPISVGIGLHTGEVLAGFFGSNMRLEYSVQGDAVCIASKACDAAKDNQVCATEDTLLEAFPHYAKHKITIAQAFNELEKKTIRGKKKAVSFYKVDMPDDIDNGQTEIIKASHAVFVPLLPEKFIKDEPENYPYLVYQCSYGVNELHYLKNENVLIGRDTKSDIVIKGTMKGISRVHSEIIRFVNNGLITGISIVDKNSTLGTYVNGEKLAQNGSRTLNNGDRIGFANVIFMEYYQNRASIPARYLQNSFEDFESNVEFVNPSVEESIMTKAELCAADEVVFKPADTLVDSAEFQQDYSKLCLLYELSKISLKSSLSSLLKKGLDCIFDVISTIDSGALVLLDSRTGPSAKLVKFRQKEDKGKDMKLSSNIFKRVFDSKKKLITTDATADANLHDIASVTKSLAKTIICLPLVSHQKVHGIVYLAAFESSQAISKKDMSLLDAICNQMCRSIENFKIRIENQDTTKIRDQLSRFLGPALVQKIASPDAILDKKGSRKSATIMYINIIDFSSFREKNADTEVESTLNAYFEIAVQAVFKARGIVDKYIGNQLMAVFGTIDTSPEPEFRAVQAAIDIRDEIEKMNQEREIFKKDRITIKIGINTGTVVAGLIGGTLRLEYTVIGDAVNIAARTMTSASANQILMTEDTFSIISDKLVSEEIGEKKFKGKSFPIKVYNAISVKDDYRMAPPPLSILHQAPSLTFSSSDITRLQ